MKGLRMETIEEKIIRLGEIVNKYEEIETGTDVTYFPSSAGGVTNTKPERYETTIYSKRYIHPEKERKAAVKQLKRILKTCQNDCIKKLIKKQLGKSFIEKRADDFKHWKYKFKEDFKKDPIDAVVMRLFKLLWFTCLIASIVLLIIYWIRGLFD